MTFDEAIEEIAAQNEVCRIIIEQVKASAKIMNEQEKRRAEIDDDIIITKASPTSRGIYRE